MLCVLKLSPAKEKAAVRELDVLEPVDGEVWARLDKLVEDALACFLFTDN